MVGGVTRSKFPQQYRTAGQVSLSPEEPPWLARPPRRRHLQMGTATAEKRDCCLARARTVWPVKKCINMPAKNPVRNVSNAKAYKLF